MPRLMPARVHAALRRDARTPLELPDEIATEARRRVRVAAALGAGAYAVFLLLELTRMQGSSALERRIDLTHDAIGLALTAALLLVTFVRPIPNRAVIVYALAAQVLIAALISVAVPWAGYVRTGHLVQITWVVPLMLLVPVLVPTRGGITLGVSLACALAMAVGPALLSARGAVAAQPADLVASFVTGAVAAGFATVVSHTLYGARREIAAARTVGSYELIERIASGGMGEVWKARHLLLARPAALKLILPESLQGADERRTAVMERFLREAQATAGLRSPHTVELYDFGATGDGTLYYVMELLDGINLEHFIYRYGPIEPKRAVDWLRQVCHSLGEAHARGLVHRDIKPANLMVCRQGRDLDVLKVLDFGLARPEGSARPLDPATAVTRGAIVTAAGARMGTPGYMAPEQVLGFAVDARTDLYALGGVGYWLLAGARPFEADHAEALMEQQVSAAPPPLAPRTAHPISAALEEVILSCLAKDPEARPRDADDLRARLEAALGGEPWSETHARQWWASNTVQG